MGPAPGTPKPNQHGSISQQQQSTVRRRTRSVLLCFNNQSDRDYIWRNRKGLKGTNIYLKEDLPQEVENKAKELVPNYKEARKTKKKANMIRDQLFIEGQSYTQEHLDSLPPDIHPSTLANKEIGEKHFFLGEEVMFF